MEPAPTPAERLIADLNRLRRDAGSPSLGELVRLSEHKLSTSTLHDHLTGRRTRPPPWGLVSAYVYACHDAAENTGLDVQHLGTLKEWHARWVAASSDNHDMTSEAAGANSTNLATKPNPMPGNRDEPPSHPVVEGSPAFGKHSDTTATVSIAPVIRRIEEDLSNLGKSLSPNTGLLVVTSGPTIGTRFVLEHNITTIGRAPENDIWLNDPAVSRRHAEIRRRGDAFFVRDVGSHNGSVLRQHVVKAEAEIPIFAYDELQIGTFILMFLQAGQKPKKSQRNYQPIRSRLIEDTMASTKEDRWRLPSLLGQKEEPVQDWSMRHRWRWPWS
jgi:pSer/pThr/pTyr-binding forkhead associated (FHA) protein